MLRHFYTILFYLALPLVILRLLWKSRLNAHYRKNIGMRFACSPLRFEKSIWIHAVSLGETRLAEKLIAPIKAAHPNTPIVFTSATPTARAQVMKMQEHNPDIHHHYIPFDTPMMMRAFIKKINPLCCAIIETELWPNMLHTLHKQQIPCFLINARLSAQSAQKYQRIAKICADMLGCFTRIYAQDPDHVRRFMALGASEDKIAAYGQMKYDVRIDPSIAENATHLLSAHPKPLVWVAASTHHPEEQYIVDTYVALKAQFKNLLLVLAPRHPERASACEKYLSQKGLSFQRRSQKGPLDAQNSVLLGDTLGDMMLYYQMSDVVFIGGSLIPHGGQNPIEPAALGKPLVTGPHMHNFAHSFELFLEGNALVCVKDQAHLLQEMRALLEDPKRIKKMGQQAKALMQAHQGATARLCEDFLTRF